MQSREVGAATRELDAIRRDARWAPKNDDLRIAIEGAQLERDCAADELEYIREAQEILGRGSAKLDAEGRAALAEVIEVLTDVDWPLRMYELANETRRLRELRMRLPGPRN